ncbi:helix-turn-helix domain-containing protein [Pantoea sp. Bo_2]|uniref:helix-turn-helix domain-containing protein n=1 Tax=unclassified Pantoea TaxID=2630326 RepID=UPI001232F34D|nr:MULTISPECIES: helix-turn-helix transcriptional regulator [unclassified Pantoea]KAA5942286.1 helix-turn-helix domain-containing protein [Pantoea sp. VH_3]KAA5950136.1 helix-turn-helix domain-containing protein [Pantoea sp. VH_25]KAA5952436.1 helix-turn-helix domain-containing protein [Pantoea sp. VH_16]KAA5957883.1 helix-turn-helix domain-containing protein [Pantoea sp. VH_24]KAA5962877.1 helix-turn-helix domain-containing protein [Pantoea sp. VH_18]
MTKKVNITTDAGADVATVNQAVSDRIKSWRKSQKLSLDELSRRAGVSKGMLVEIEKGAANPSIAILCKVAAALGVSVADIVSISHAPDAWLIKNSEMPVLWQGEQGGSAQLLAGTRGPDMIELWRWQMFAGEVFSSSGHSSGTLELLHVEQGTLVLTVGEQTLVVQQGCAAVARTDMPHAYASADDQPVIFTMTVAELQR